MDPDEYKIGERVLMPNGREYVYRGGDPTRESSWRWVPTTEQIKKHATGMVREVAQGATLGWADEIEAMLRGKPREEIEAARQEYRDEGGSSFVPQILGGALLPGLGSFKLGQNLLSRYSAAVRALTYGGIGLTEGAIAGAGASEPGERVQGARGGALMGGTAGVALPAAGAGLRAVGGAARRLTSPRLQQEAAMSLAEAGQTAIPQGGRFSDLAVNQGDILADVAPEFRGAGRAAMRARPENTAEFMTQLETRNQQIYEALEDAPRRLANMPPGQARDQALAALRKTRSDKINALYDPLKVAGEVADPRVANLVAEIAEDPGVARTAAAVARRVGNTNSAEYLIELDKAINSQVSAGYRMGQRDLTAETFRDELREIMEDAVPGYRDARKAAAPIYRAEEVAMDASTKWRTSWDPSNIRYHLRDLSEDGLQEVRAVVVSDLQAELAKRLDLDNPRGAFNWIRQMGPRLRAVFGEDAANQYIEQMAALGRQAETFVEMSKGAKSAANLGASRDTFFSNMLQASAYATNKMYGASFRTIIQGVLGRSQVERAFQREIAELVRGDPRRALSMLDEAMPFVEAVRRRNVGSSAFLAGMGGQGAGLSRERP